MDRWTGNRPVHGAPAPVQAPVLILEPVPALRGRRRVTRSMSRAAVEHAANPVPPPPHIQIPVEASRS